MNALKIVDLMYVYLGGTSLRAAITGGMYKNNERPVNSTKEDIVISNLGTPNLQLQQSVLNVNIWVPELETNGTWYPDHARMEVLAALAESDLKLGVFDGYHFRLQQQLLFREEQVKQYFINNRVEFYSKNIKGGTKSWENLQ